MPFYLTIIIKLDILETIIISSQQESTTDVVNPQCPTLLDLGVNLTQIEDQAPWELKPYRAYQYYIDQLGEFPKPDPPKVHC